MSDVEFCRWKLSVIDAALDAFEDVAVVADNLAGGHRHVEGLYALLRAQRSHWRHRLREAEEAAIRRSHCEARR